MFGNVPDLMAVVGTILISVAGILSIEAGHAEVMAMLSVSAVGTLNGKSSAAILIRRYDEQFFPR